MTVRNLKNGGQAEEAAIGAVMGSLESMAESMTGALALYDLLKVCKGEAATITDTARQQELLDFDLVQEFDSRGAPTILDSIRDITASSVEFKGLTVVFKDPRK